ncbi:MAG: ATP-dependent helicase [Clostridiales bacterium]|nr:ATP-dependent helicase [Clostridiales bacterium]
MTFNEFKSQYHVRLNPQQEAAVRQTDGPVLLLAVPGSGKTTVLVTRLGHMIYCKNIRPENILTVTYTVAATKDMKARFVRFFGEDHADRLTFRTINGLCAVVIRYYAAQKGTQPFALADDEARLNAVVRELLSKGGGGYPSDQQVKEARTQIAFCKNMMFSDAEVETQKVDGMDFLAVYKGYQAFLLKNRLMDFDDQMVFTYRIFRQYPDILAYFQRRWPYLCVDEAQDTSKIQHAILRLLASKSRNIFMVGDEDQSIYGFRAAWPQALLEFEQTYPGAKVLMMETNYRSTKSIVEAADSFIQRNESRRPKHMRTGSAQGVPVKKVALADYNRQYNYLLKIALNCKEQTAVLYRNNDSALPLIDLLEREGVPYACRQREGFFFTSPIVRDITDMLEFAFNDCDWEKFLRFYYKLDLKIKKPILAGMLRGIHGDETVFDRLLANEGLEPWQYGKIRALQTHYSKFPQLTSFAAIQRLVKYMGYGDYLREQKMDTTRLDVLLALANQTPATGPFLLRLQELRETIEGMEPDPSCPFVLSTIHASKGLEYDRVILIDAVDGTFPSDPFPHDDEGRTALEEERRLFYVGATRAKRQLELLCYEGKFGEPAGAGHTFIDQLLGEEPPAFAPEPQFNPQPKPKRARAKPPAYESGPTPAQLAKQQENFMAGAEVVHEKFGRGEILGRLGSIALIAFEDLDEVKRIELTTCLKKGLIRLAGL